MQGCVVPHPVSSVTNQRVQSGKIVVICGILLIPVSEANLVLDVDWLSPGDLSELLTLPCVLTLLISSVHCFTRFLLWCGTMSLHGLVFGIRFSDGLFFVNLELCGFFNPVRTSAVVVN